MFVLHFIQARDPELVGRPFFAKYDPDAVWLTDLKPAFADRFPFEAAPTANGAASNGASNGAASLSDPALNGARLTV